MILNKEETEKILQNVTEKTAENKTENNNIPPNLTQINPPTSPEPAEQSPEPTINLPQRSRLRDVLPEPELNTGCSFQAW